jgi:hypothetical protein
MKRKISVRKHRRRTKQGSTLVSRHYRKLKGKKQADLFGKIIERQFKKPEEKITKSGIIGKTEIAELAEIETGTELMEIDFDILKKRWKSKLKSIKYNGFQIFSPPEINAIMEFMDGFVSDALDYIEEEAMFNPDKIMKDIELFYSGEKIVIVNEYSIPDFIIYTSDDALIEDIKQNIIQLFGNKGLKNTIESLGWDEWESLIDGVDLIPTFFEDEDIEDIYEEEGYSSPLDYVINVHGDDYILAYLDEDTLKDRIESDLPDLITDDSVTAGIYEPLMIPETYGETLHLFIKRFD